VAGLAVVLALPFTQAAAAAPGAVHGSAAVPGFTLSVVHEFPQALEETPKFLALSKDGNLYQLTPAGAFHIVATFNGTDGAGPDELALGADGALYGTTEVGGSTGGGVIFKLTLPHRPA
jgi:uncharacterized repeat protein (TIGR03803 family)